MSSTTRDEIWPQLYADLVGTLGVRHERTDSRFERLNILYERCVESLPINAPVDIPTQRAEIKAFHALVRQSIIHIRTGWPTATKVGIRDALTSAVNTDADTQNGTINSRPDLGLVNTAIDAALCLWLSIDCVDENRSGVMSWPETETVQQFVLRRRFDVAVEADPRDHVRYFPQKFRAVFLDEISGIHIEQTYYLDQHLRFGEETRTVKIFMDIGWLKASIRLFQSVIDTADGSDGDVSPVNSGQAHADCPQDLQIDGQIDGDIQLQRLTEDAVIIGNKEAAKDLLPIFEEALRTLDVLFPAWHGKTIAFVKDFRDNGSTVPWFDLQDLTGQAQQELHKFSFWRSRLTQLIMEYQSPPRDLKHIWSDNRNPVAFLTFWIGMAIFFLTLIFGTIASVLAGLALRNKST